MKRLGFGLVSAITLLTAQAATAQDQPLPPEVIAPAVDGVIQEPTGPTWQAFARSATTIYLVDLGSSSTSNGITDVRMARLDRSGSASDLSHTIEQFYLRCSNRQYRNSLSIEYGPDGREEDRYDDGGSPTPTDGIWEGIIANSNVDFIRRLVCDDERPTAAPFVSIAAFIEAGRP